MEKVNHLKLRRFIVLTDREILAFTDDKGESKCTMNLYLDEISAIDQESSVENTFVNCYNFSSLKMIRTDIF